MLLLCLTFDQVPVDRQVWVFGCGRAQGGPATENSRHVAACGVAVCVLRLRRCAAPGRRCHGHAARWLTCKAACHEPGGLQRRAATGCRHTVPWPRHCVTGCIEACQRRAFPVMMGRWPVTRPRVNSLTSSSFSLNMRILPAGVAQLVEQLICNQQVAGSSPFASSSVRSVRCPLVGHLSGSRRGDSRAVKGIRL